MDRKLIAKYTSNDVDVKMMTDSQFVDYACELVKQKDGVIDNVTNVIQSTSKTLSQNTKNKKKKTLKEWLSYITMVGIILLVSALCCLMLCSLLYFFVYFGKDSVKSTIDFSLLLRATALVGVFGIFFGLFTKMTQYVKKIISLF